MISAISTPAHRRAPAASRGASRRLAGLLLLLVLGIPARAQGPGSISASAAEEARLRSAILLNPRVASFHAGLGDVLRERGQLAEAAQSYAEAARLDPRNPDHAAALGEVRMQTRDWAGAAEAFASAVAADSTRAAYQVRLAEALHAAGDPEGARAALWRARSLSPGDTAVRRLSRVLEAGDDPREVDLGALAATAGRLLVRALTLTAAVLLTVAGLAMAIPILGAVYLLLVRTPLHLLRRPGAPA